MGCCIGKSKSSADRTSLSLTYETDTANGLSSSLLSASHASHMSTASAYASSNMSAGSMQSPVALLSEADSILLAANYCKDKSPFTWCDEALPCIGSREHKWHYSVKGDDSEARQGGKAKLVRMVMVLTYLRREGDQAFPIPLSSATILEVFASLVCGLENPYIFPCEDADYIRDRNTLVVTRKWADAGSLRDLVYRQNPKTPFSQKNNRAHGKSLPLAQVQTYGRHVLEACSALNAKGIVADCLTCANVLVVRRVARLSDLENSLLGGGASAELVEVLMQLAARAIEDGATPCAFDVQLFGLVLLEMATGAPMLAGSFLQEVADGFCERTFPPCSTPEDKAALAALHELLGDIFSRHSASVSSLLASPFFAHVSLPAPSSRLKLSSAEKGLVKSAMKASQESRAVVLARIQAERAAEESERQQRLRDIEETALAVSTADSRGDTAHSRRVSVLKRQSTGKRKSTSAPTSPSLQTGEHNTNGDSSGDSIGQQEKSLAMVPSTTGVHDNSGNDDQRSPNEGSEGSLPEKYKKMLSIGLAREQVLHRMVQDGVDPRSVGW